MFLRDLISVGSAKVLVCEQNMERTAKDLNAIEWHDLRSNRSICSSMAFAEIHLIMRFRAVIYNNQDIYFSK